MKLNKVIENRSGFTTKTYVTGHQIKESGLPTEFYDV